MTRDTPTPRTDQIDHDTVGLDYPYPIMLEHARQLERELTARREGVPEGCTEVDIAVLRKANVDLASEVERLKTGLRFYAHGHHWITEGQSTSKWDTCSGEPQNWWWRENEDDSAEGIEDGGIAQVYLSGKEPDWEGEPPLEHPCEPVMKAIAEAEKQARALKSTERKEG